jgi:hypothetical protein
VTLPRLWRVLAIALPALGALIAPLPAVDLAYQLRAGADILASGTIPTTDTWTFTAAGAAWLDQQWGAQVLLAAVYQVGSWTGLVLLRAALVAISFGLLQATIRARAPGSSDRSVALVTIGAFIVAANALALRPQLIAIDLLAATLWLLAVRDRWPRAVWAIPFLALAWANVHGTFPIAAGLCGLAWLADLYDGRQAHRGGHHRMLLVGLVSAAVTVVTPFGPGVWVYVTSLASNPTIATRVSEWQPPSPLTIPGALVWLSVVAVAAVVTWRLRGLRRAALAGRPPAEPHHAGAFRATWTVPWPAILTLALFGSLALTNGRGVAWWPFVAAFVIAGWLPVEPAPRPTPPLLRRLNAVTVAILAVVGVALLPVWRPLGPAGVPLGVVSYAPQGIAAYLRDTGLSRTNVWNPQPWGSWLELAAPARTYALDSRIELFPAAIWDDADVVRAGGPGTEAVLDRWKVGVVIVEWADNTAFDGAAHAFAARWVRAYADCDGSVWVQTGPAFSRGPWKADVPLPEACP